MTRRRSERGSALVEVSWLGILLVLPVLWIVMSVFQVQRGAFGLSGAGDLYAVPQRLPPGHLGDHGLGALTGRAADDAERVGEQPAELRPRRDPDGADRVVPGARQWLSPVHADVASGAP